MLVSEKTNIEVLHEAANEIRLADQAGDPVAFSRLGRQYGKCAYTVFKKLPSVLLPPDTVLNRAKGGHQVEDLQFWCHGDAIVSLSDFLKLADIEEV